MAYTDPSTLTWNSGEKPTAAKMNQATNDQFLALFPHGAAGAAWSPVLEAANSNPTTSSATGRQFQVGGLLFLWARFVITNPGSGRWFVTLPKAAANLTPNGSMRAPGNVIGGWQAGTDGPFVSAGGLVLSGSNTVVFARSDIAGGGVCLGDSATAPFVGGWKSGDAVTFWAVYPVA